MPKVDIGLFNLKADEYIHQINQKIQAVIAYIDNPAEDEYRFTYIKYLTLLENSRANAVAVRGTVNLHDKEKE
jgi:hypothetical protein